MNLKIAVFAALIVGMVAVPLVAAAPVLQQDMLQTRDQDRLQTKDCTSTCLCDGSGVGAQLQTRVQENLQTCNQQQLQTRDSNGEGSALQNKTRLQEDCGYGAENGALGTKQFNYQYRYQHQNQSP